MRFIVTKAIFENIISSMEPFLERKYEELENEETENQKLEKAKLKKIEAYFILFKIGYKSFKTKIKLNLLNTLKTFRSFYKINTNLLKYIFGNNNSELPN